jgi:hypothetical protein
MPQHKEPIGFMTFAHNTPEVNYLELAYLQALNIKATQQIKSYAVLVNSETAEQVTDRHRQVFDYVIPHSGPGTFIDEPKAFWFTPFKETIKSEADLLFTRSIDHWWTAFRLRDVCLSYKAKNFHGIESGVRRYREMFDANQLPDVYNGLMYFRHSQAAADFFMTASSVARNWDVVKENLKRCFEDLPSTDVLYAITALIVDQETVSMPSMDFLNFVHMKSAFNGWSDAASWLDTVMSERDGDIIRINNLNQLDPVHYHDKTYATQELIKYYEQRVLG